MLEPFLHAPGSEMAIVGFDSEVKLRHDFTSDTAGLAQKLRDLPAGDSGNAVLDALRFSLDLLKRRPPEHRRVLVLISEMRDHGSTTTTFEETARRITAINAEFYAIAFQGGVGEGTADLVRSLGGPIVGGGQTSLPGPSVGGGPPSRGVGNLSLLSLIRGVAEAMKTNVPQGIVDLTGGEYIVFNDARTFDSALGILANHAQNRYQLSFQASNPTPGPHKLEVFLAGGGGKVVARSGYWPEAEKRQAADPKQ